MSACCGQPQTRETGVRCPVSSTMGEKVDLQTVKALLREHPLRRISTLVHHFCPDPACEVVYFDAAGAVYLMADIRASVWQKEPFGRRMICYCFDENEAAMLAECEQSGTTDAAARVRAHIAARRCACEVRNPRGVCCLGDVMTTADRVKEMIAARAAARS